MAFQNSCNVQLIDLTTVETVNTTMIKRVVQAGQPAILRYLSAAEVPNYLILLQHKYADEEVTLLQRPVGLTNAAAHGKLIKSTLGEYFRHFVCQTTDPEHDYIVLSSLNDHNALLQVLMDESYCQLFPQKHDLRLWITPKARFTGAHFDSVETFNLQFYGSKKFILYPPGIFRYKIRSPFTGFGHTSKFNNFKEVNIDKNPGWQRILETQIEIELQPGEMIYIPPGWWHQVYNEDSLAINGLLNFYGKKKLLTKPYILFDLMIKLAKKKCLLNSSE